jgi:VanZ family protein
LIRIFQIFCALALVAALGLFCVLALAPPGTDFGVFANRPDDKAGHFAVFFLLGPLAAAAFPRVRITWIAVGLLFFSAATEYGQTFTGREASLEDFAANLLGLMAGMFPLAAYRLRLALGRAARARADMQAANDT